MRTFKKWVGRIALLCAAVAVLFVCRFLYAEYKVVQAQQACMDNDTVKMQDSDRYHLLGSDDTVAVEEKGYVFDLKAGDTACGYTLNGYVGDGEYLIALGKCTGVFQDIETEHRFAVIRDPSNANRGRVSASISGLPSVSELRAQDGFTDC